MPGVTFARAAEPRSERSQMWLTTRQCKLNGLHLLSVFSVNRKCDSPRDTARQLLATFSSAQVEPLLFLTQTSLHSGMLQGSGMLLVDKRTLSGARSKKCRSSSHTSHIFSPLVHSSLELLLSRNV